MNDQKNTLLAIVLSGVVLLAWSYFFAPQLPRQTAPQQQQQQQAQNQSAPPPGTAPSKPPVPGQSAAVPGAQTLTREEALKQSARIDVATPNIKGSIALKGGRIDDVSLPRYRETVDPKSPPIDLLSPSGSPQPFYAEFGWVAAAGAGAKTPALPSADTVWHQE